MSLDANGALLVSAIGIVLICAEFCLPGWVVFGVAGGGCLCFGIHQLTMLQASPAVGTGLAVVLAGAAAAGYGLIPEWVGWASILAVPLLSRLVAPGAVHWAVAVGVAVAPATIFHLLKIAGRAAANKTLI